MGRLPNKMLRSGFAGGVSPFGLLQVNICPPHGYQFTGPTEQQRQQFECRTDKCRCFEVRGMGLYSSKQPRHILRVGECRLMLCIVWVLSAFLK
jgi:hypothetical protein